MINISLQNKFWNNQCTFYKIMLKNVKMNISKLCYTRYVEIIILYTHVTILQASSSDMDNTYIQASFGDLNELQQIDFSL